MIEPLWVNEELAKAVHARQLREFGGPPGIRDETMLASALDRPRNKFMYEQADMPALAAAYAYGIARNHPFVDGNKRAALLTMVVFLDINGVDFTAPEHEATVIILELAAGQVSDDGLTRWIRDNWPQG
jgi:death-on-curing protein